MYSSPDTIRNLKTRQLRWAEYVASKSAYRILVEKPEGKRPLGRPRRREEDDIKIDLREVICDAGVWVDLAQDRVQWRTYLSTITKFRVI